MTLLLRDCGAQESTPAEVYSAPSVEGVLFLADFQTSASSMTGSSDAKYAGQKYTVGEKSSVVSGIDGDKALHFDKASHFGLTSMIENIAPNGGDLVLQYEVRFTESVTCGGAYLKFLDAKRFSDPKSLNNESPYIVMFGPDKCGSDTNKVHFILRHENPVSHEWTEHHFNSPPKIKTDVFTHLYTLVIHSDNTFEIKIDDKIEKTGSLLEDMTPPINPAHEIDDPNDKKPADWVDEAKINDPEASKPDDWDEDAPKKIPDMSIDKPAGWWDDEPEKIPDPTAEVPEDWDEEDDGIWEAPLVTNPKCSDPGCGKWNRPLIDNPDYKGKWVHPQIDNPDYIGEWAPKQIENPNFFVDESPFDFPAIGAVSIEVMTNFGGTSFDNILIASSAEAASNFASQTYGIKAGAEKTKAGDRERAARHKARLKYLEDGSIIGKIQYYSGEGIETMRSNPIAAIMTILALVVGSIYACCKACSCCSDDDDYVDSLDDDDDANAPAPAPVKEEKELQANADGEEKEDKSKAEEPVKEDTSAGDTKADKGNTSEADKDTSGADKEGNDDNDIPPSMDTPTTDKKKKKKKRSEKERE